MSSEVLRESETVELKKSMAELKEGLVSIAAILNKHGAGELWFGVAPSGKPVGLDVTDKTLRDLSQAIAAHIEPKIYPQVSTQAVGDKTCIHIRFDGQNAPYFAHGRAYMRVADADRQLSAAELETIIVDKNQNALRWDTRALDKPWPDLEIKKVKSFAKRAGLQWDTLGEDDEMRLQHALTKLELLQKGELCNAARLFFAKEPIQLRCAVFGTTDTVTIIDRHDFDGDILELIEEAQKYILKNIHIGMRLEGLYRVDVPEISMDALREAIINAFCHRDWRDPDYVQVAIFKNRVEVRNPGKLYGGLTIEDLHRGNVSKRRNPLIADLFRRIEMVESWGRGMTLIHQNAPAVTFRQVDEAKAVREEVAFLQGVKVILTKKDISAQKKTDEQRELAIRQIINSAVVSSSVVDIFDAVGLDKPNIGLLSDEFLAQVKNLPEKNLAVELLERLLEGEIKSRFASNVVQDKKFSELLASVIQRYQNRSIETAQVMEELVAMAKKFREAASRGIELRLSEDEVKFYDALATNESAVRELTDETLKKIAHELTENLRQSLSVDWSERESVRAKLRLMVKRILRKYKYPPDLLDGAVELVLQQAQAQVMGESWAETF